MAKELPKNSHRVSDVLLRAVRCVERSEVLLRMPGDGMLEAWGWDAGSSSTVRFRGSLLPVNKVGYGRLKAPTKHGLS